METAEPTVDPNFSLGPQTDVMRLRNEVNSLSILVNVLSKMNHQTQKELKELRKKLIDMGVNLGD